MKVFFNIATRICPWEIKSFDTLCYINSFRLVFDLSSVFDYLFKNINNVILFGFNLWGLVYNKNQCEKTLSILNRFSHYVLKRNDCLINYAQELERKNLELVRIKHNLLNEASKCNDTIDNFDLLNDNSELIKEAIISFERLINYSKINNISAIDIEKYQSLLTTKGFFFDQLTSTISYFTFANIFTLIVILGGGTYVYALPTFYSSAILCSYFEYKTCCQMPPIILQHLPTLLENKTLLLQTIADCETQKVMFENSLTEIVILQQNVPP